MGWFEDKAKRDRRVLVLPITANYVRELDLHMSLQDYWEHKLTEYAECAKPWTGFGGGQFRGMSFSEFLSYDYYKFVEHNSKWTDQDYAKTALYRNWKAEYETAIEQHEYAQYRSDVKPVITWPDRRRNMVRVYKKTGEN